MTPPSQIDLDPGYDDVHADIVALLESARRAAARSVNALMTASYWEIGRRIVEFEQGGAERAQYGKGVLRRLAQDLNRRFGRGFSADNLELMRLFFLTYPSTKISETLSRKSAPTDSPINAETLSWNLNMELLAQALPLSWSHYVKLMRMTRSAEERDFYEAEALRGGWSLRQLDRQIGTQFYTRTLMSKNKRAMLEKGSKPQPCDAVTPEEAVKDPYVLEFLNLQDEYSESELEDALIHRLEDFLLELGSDFTFVGRQRRLRIGDSWFRVDLLFFHRRLRCLVIIDLKLTPLDHADVGQMHMYCNYAREHWTLPGENPPVGLILCAKADSAVARYALEGLPNTILAAEYQTILPEAQLLAEEMARSRREWEAQKLIRHDRKKTT